MSEAGFATTPFHVGTIGTPRFSMRQMLTTRVTERGAMDAALLRLVAMVGSRFIRDIEGAEHIAPDRDPFILAMNHSTCLEALLVPSCLLLLRGGKSLHFLADWNFRLIPGINLLYKRAEVITVMRKSARPAFLNVLKPYYADALAPHERATKALLEGRSLGVFPEGTVNRRPDRLLSGCRGTAILAMKHGVPVIPAGISFPDVKPGQKVPEGSPLVLRIGAPLTVEPKSKNQTFGVQARQFHHQIMSQLSVLSGKAWDGELKEIDHGYETHHVSQACRDRD